MSSSSTPLLRNNNQKKDDDHPIFLRACHSSWSFVSQPRLAFCRGVIAAYMLAAFIFIINYAVVHERLGWMTIFEFSNVVYFIQLLYQSTVFIWTFIHLQYPRLSNEDNSFSMRLKKLLSPPSSSASAKNHHWFSILYSAATTFPHVTTFIYWALLVPKHETTYPDDQTFGHGDNKAFYLFNKYGVNSIIALFEVFVFSSIKRPDLISSHLGGVFTASLWYIGWAFIGYTITGKFGFYFLDHHRVGWDNVIMGSIAFIGVSEFFFFAVYSLKGLRETLQVKGEEKGYARLPH